MVCVPWLTCPLPMWPSAKHLHEGQGCLILLPWWQGLTSLLWDLKFWPVLTDMHRHGRPGHFLHLVPLSVTWFWKYPFLLSRAVLQGGTGVGLRETVKGPGWHLLSWHSEISSWFTKGQTLVVGSLTPRVGSSVTRELEWEEATEHRSVSWDTQWGQGWYLCYGYALFFSVPKTTVLNHIWILGRRLRCWEVVLGSNHRWGGELQDGNSSS